jgi:sugar fermentation stimulation protein A
MKAGMKYSSPLQRVTLIKRYKRFLADVILADGSQITVHTPNTGSMLGCSEPGSRIWIRDSGNDQRKYRYSWELSELESGILVGVNTSLPNQLVAEAIRRGVVESLNGYAQLRTEVPYGQERSRIDILLEDDGAPPCYVEVKNVTARSADHAIFPDAVTARGAKHLRELMQVVKEGGRGVIFFCVQREDVTAFRPAHEIDPLYAATLKQAIAAGVEAMAWRASLTPAEVVLRQPLSLEF